MTFAAAALLHAVFRLAASRAHVTGLILALLFGLVLAVGHATGTGWQRWFCGLSFATVASVFVFTILALDDPRFGLIQLKDQDVALPELPQSMR